METCLNALPSEIECPQPRRLYYESLQMVIPVSLMQQFSGLSTSLPSCRRKLRSRQLPIGGLARRQIRRVMNYSQSNRAQDFGINGTLFVTDGRPAGFREGRIHNRFSSL